MVKYVVISGISYEDIKKEVLSISDLDTRSLNNTVKAIENRELASRAVASPSQQHNASAIYSNTSKDIQTKLTQKTKCNGCNKTIQRFKLRRRGASKRLKEFNLCVSCWVKEKTQSDDNTAPQNKQTTGTIFDVLPSASIHTEQQNLYRLCFDGLTLCI